MQPMTQIQTPSTYVPPTEAQLQREIAQSKPRVRSRLVEKIRRWETTGQLDQPFVLAHEPPAEDEGVFQENSLVKH